MLIKSISITGKGEPMLHPKFYKFCKLCNDLKIPFSVTTNGDYYRRAKKILDMEYLTGVRVSIYDKKAWDNWKTTCHPKLSFFNQSGEHIDGIPDGYITSNYEIDHPRALKDFNNETFCKAPFSFMTVNTDGSVVPCYSYDNASNIKDSWWKIWNGREIRRYRRKAVNGRDMNFADCNNCGIIL